jgi:hypothetical protein
MRSGTGSMSMQHRNSGDIFGGWRNGRRRSTTVLLRTGLFVQSLNEVLDGFDRSEAELNIHVPELVIILLVITFLITASIFGYASGTEGHRPTMAANIFLVIIVLLTFLIIDLDRPRRGLIKVSQQSLVALKNSMNGDK